MRWNKDRRDDRAARLIGGYFKRQLDSVEVPALPETLGGVTERREHRARPPAPTRALPNLVCALALAAGLAVVAVNIGRPSSLAALLEERASRHGWTTTAPAALDAAQKTIAISLNGG